MKKNFDGLTLNFKNLHIHLDEHTEINNEYPSPMTEDDEPKCHCCGCDDDPDLCDDDEDDDSEDEDESFTDEDVIKAVASKTGFPELFIRKILDAQGEILVERLLGDIVKPHKPNRKSGDL